MASSEAAAKAVAAFVAAPPRDGEVESIAVVDVANGQWPLNITPGVELRWRQDDRQFGLLMPIDRLVLQAGDLDGVAFYLRLAVEEPHDAPPDGSRLWFTDLPSGPY